MADTTYDGIILGAGHNGLILQAFLCRAGLHVVCLERDSVAGGGLRTEEWPAGSGFLHNTHSFYHRGVTRMPWYAGLELDRRGARYLEPDLNVALLLADGRSLAWWTDFERTAESFARFSRRDADALRRWRDAFRPVVTRILEPEAQTPPLPPRERRRRLEATAEGRLLLETSALSPREFVLREFESPVVQAGLLFFNGLREVEPTARGFGHHVPALLAARGKAQMCAGGSARLAEALVGAVTEAGGEVRTGVEPARILVEPAAGDGPGRAAGVVTTDGERIGARHFVASSLNPQQTFLDLIDPEHLPAAWRDRAAAFRYNLLAPLFGLYLNLDEPPALLGGPHRPGAGRRLHGHPRPAVGDRLRRHGLRPRAGPPAADGHVGILPEPVRSRPGPGRRPHRLHVAEGALPPARPRRANWEAEAEAHGRRILEAWSRFAPNLADVVRGSMVRPVHEIPRRLPNMRGGDLLVGSLGHGQSRLPPALPGRRPLPGIPGGPLPVRFLLPPLGQHHRAAGVQRLAGDRRRPGARLTGPPLSA